MVKIKDFTLASKNLGGMHVPPVPKELPPMLSLLKVEPQIDSDQLIYVQWILGAQSRAETRGERRLHSREQNAGRDESRAREPVETRCREEAPAESKAERR